MPGKTSGIKTAPPGHHVDKEDRRHKAVAIAITTKHVNKKNPMLPCGCGNHNGVKEGR